MTRVLVVGGGIAGLWTAVRAADAGCEVSSTVVEGLIAEGSDYAERRDLEDRQRARIERLGVRSYELRRLPDGIDLGGLYELAEDLREQGMA